MATLFPTDICLPLTRSLSRAHRIRPVKGVGTGELVLAEARDHGADLLVMGGYGHSPWREMIFGGATRQVVSTASLPILLAH